MRIVTEAAMGAWFEGLERRVMCDAAFGAPMLAYSQIGTTQLSGDAVFADFDGDGASDMVVASGRAVRFMHGNGDGTFAPGVVTSLGSRVGKIAAGNFDGAGGADCVAVGNAGHVAVAGMPADAVGKGYFLRVLSYDAGTGGLVVRARRFMEITTERAEGSYDYADNTSILTGNLMGGARDEIVVRVVAQGAYVPRRTVVWVFATPGAGAGSIDSIALRSTVLDAPMAGGIVALGDINGDGRADVLFRPRKVWRAELYPRAGSWNDGMGKKRITIAGSTDGTPGNRGVEPLYDSAWVDVDGDGRVDRVRMLPSGPYPQNGIVYASVVVQRGVGDGTFGAAEVQPNIVLHPTFVEPVTGSADGYGDEPLTMLAGPDLNGDGRVDLVVGRIGTLTDYALRRSYSFDSFATLTPDADGTFAVESFAAARYPIPTGAPFAPTMFADVNGDGKPNLVTLVDPEGESTLFVYVQLNRW